MRPRRARRIAATMIGRRARLPVLLTIAIPLAAQDEINPLDDPDPELRRRDRRRTAGQSLRSQGRAALPYVKQAAGHHERLVGDALAKIRQGE